MSAISEDYFMYFSLFIYILSDELLSLFINSIFGLMKPTAKTHETDEKWPIMNSLTIELADSSD